MPAAPIPPTESARLAALRDYDVLDTPPEKEFDDLTRLAAHVCQTPISVMSLVDETRQWFKSRYGLDLPQTPREVAFCGYAILGRELLEVADAAADPRFADNPAVTGNSGVRFYAGAPLVTPDGHSLGTLCVVDRTVRRLTADQREAVAALARQAVVALEYRRVARQLRDALDRVHTLEGMLPICAHCHRIRDDAGAWQRLEDYFQNRAAVQFSHGICPGCLTEHYPDVILTDDPPPGGRSPG